jgi:hypothetical protein
MPPQGSELLTGDMAQALREQRSVPHGAAPSPYD